MKAKDLKKSILQLAIQGKLVPQDPKDEPASKLLDKIRVAKQTLVKEGKIKKDKQESFIYKGDDNNYYEKIGKDIRNITDEIPFEIPDSWAWVRLGNICSYIQRGKSPKYSETRKIPVISQKCIQWSGFSIVPAKFITEESLKSYTTDRFLQDQDLLWNSTGIGTVGRVTVYYQAQNPYQIAVADSHVTVLRPLKISSQYLYLFLSSPEVQDIIEQVCDGSTKQKELALSTVKQYLISLPPLEEQKRIVKKIEELETFIEEYDQAETELSELNEAFPEQIKKSILQYAIQGKLVSQDPNDEPASVLLEKIKAEKQKLIKAGKIKKDKVESYIYKRDNRHYEKIGDKEVDITDEIPFEIPPSWAWVRFKNLVHYRMGKTPQRKNEQFWEHGTFPWVSIADLISDGMLERTKEKISDYAVSQIFKGEFSPRGTLLMSFKLTVGKVSVLNINAVHNEAIISIYPYLNTDNSMRDYLFKFMPLLSQEGRTKTAIKGKTLNSDSIDALLIPLPPVAEQKRIVTKMDKLLSLFPTHN